MALPCCTGALLNTIFLPSARLMRLKDTFPIFVLSIGTSWLPSSGCLCVWSADPLPAQLVSWVLEPVLSRQDFYLLFRPWTQVGAAADSGSWVAEIPRWKLSWGSGALKRLLAWAGPWAWGGGVEVSRWLWLEAQLPEWFQAPVPECIPFKFRNLTRALEAGIEFPTSSFTRSKEFRH